MENKIEIYTTVKGTEIHIKLENDTVWLDAHTIADLFGVNRPAIVKHVGNIYKNAELPEDSTIRKFRIVRKESARKVQRNIDHDNLDILNQNKQ